MLLPGPPHSPVLPGVQLHGLREGLHSLSVAALLGSLVATACGESIGRCRPTGPAGEQSCAPTRSGDTGICWG